MDDSPTDTFFTPLKLLIVALIVTNWSAKTFWRWEIDNIVSSLCSSETKESTLAAMLMYDLLFSKMSSLPNFLLTKKVIFAGDFCACYAQNSSTCPLQSTLPSKYPFLILMSCRNNSLF